MHRGPGRTGPLADRAVAAGPMLRPSPPFGDNPALPGAASCSPRTRAAVDAGAAAGEHVGEYCAVDVASGQHGRDRPPSTRFAFLRGGGKRRGAGAFRAVVRALEDQAHRFGDFVVADLDDPVDMAPDD